MRTCLALLAALALASGCATPRRLAPVPTAPTSAVTADTGSEPPIFLDDVEIQAGDIDMIDSASISTISHFIGPAAYSRAGARAKNGVVEISTKSPDRTTPTSPLFVLDGRQIPPQLARVLDPAKIRSIGIVKGAAALPYGDRGRGGVVLIYRKVG